MLDSQGIVVKCALTISFNYQAAFRVLQCYTGWQKSFKKHITKLLLCNALRLENLNTIRKGNMPLRCYSHSPIYLQDLLLKKVAPPIIRDFPAKMTSPSQTHTVFFFLVSKCGKVEVLCILKRTQELLDTLLHATIL